MLAVERSHRPIESLEAGQAAEAAEPVDASEAVQANERVEIDPWVRPRPRPDSGTSRSSGVPRCASCGEAGQADPRCGGVVFCPECLRRARDLTEWDDLGGGD